MDMLVRELLLLEVQPWTKFTGASSSRVWFNARTGQAVTAAEEGNHTVGVVNNPETFGLTPEDLEAAGVPPNLKVNDPLAGGENAMDYDGNILMAAMQKGWVRIRIDPRQPDIASNAEAINAPYLRRALLWYVDKLGMPIRFVLVLRHGTAMDAGHAVVLNGKPEVEQFIQTGRLQRDLVNQNQPTLMRHTQNTGKHPLWGG